MTRAAESPSRRKSPLPSLSNAVSFLPSPSRPTNWMLASTAAAGVSWWQLFCRPTRDRYRPSMERGRNRKGDVPDCVEARTQCRLDAILVEAVGLRYEYVQDLTRPIECLAAANDADGDTVAASRFPLNWRAVHLIPPSNLNGDGGRVKLRKAAGWVWDRTVGEVSVVARRGHRGASASDVRRRPSRSTLDRVLTRTGEPCGDRHVPRKNSVQERDASRFRSSERTGGLPRP
jgi:hypothetical protein